MKAAGQGLAGVQTPGSQGSAAPTAEGSVLNIHTAGGFPSSCDWSSAATLLSLCAEE